MHLNVSNALLNNVANIFFFGDVANRVSFIAFRLGRRIFGLKDVMSRFRAIFVMMKNHTRMHQIMVGNNKHTLGSDRR
jgi:hypothetical protein